MVFIKDIIVTPGSVPNDGAACIHVQCTVFSQNEQARIKKVWIDMRHTVLCAVFPLEPDFENILSSSFEGYYKGGFDVPRLMDAGTCRLLVLATDSKGGEGMAVARFEIVWNLDILPVSTPEFISLQESCGHSPFVPGNSVEVLEDGEKALARRLDMIKNASKQINLQSYTFDRAGAGGVLMDALLEKADQEVEVNVILNSDSQISASPLGALRLKANQLFHEWTRSNEQAGPGQGEPESFKNRIIRRKKIGRLNLVMFSGRSVTGGQEVEKKYTDHWLSRMLDNRDRKPGQPPDPGLSSFSGPGGLPGLPLLDYAIHEKILVVDGKQAIVGGRNLESRYFEHWQDLDLFFEGPVVSRIQEGFLQSFNEFSEPDKQIVEAPVVFKAQDNFSGKPKEHGVMAQFVQSRPWACQDYVLLSVANSIAACRSHFFATSQYLVLPECMLKDAILDAAARGVDVRILTNSARTCGEVGFATAYYVTLNYLDELLDAGVRIFEAIGLEDEKAPQPYLHTKEFMFDGQLAAVGSFNLSMRSSHIESENLVFIHDRNFCQTRENAFIQTITDKAREITPDYFAKLKDMHKTRIDLSRHLELLF